jgi:hypothetical protein
MGSIIPYTIENKKCLKSPTSIKIDDLEVPPFQETSIWSVALPAFPLKKVHVASLSKVLTALYPLSTRHILGKANA